MRTYSSCTIYSRVKVRVPSAVLYFWIESAREIAVPRCLATCRTSTSTSTNTTNTSTTYLPFREFTEDERLQVLQVHISSIVLIEGSNLQTRIT